MMIPTDTVCVRNTSGNTLHKDDDGDTNNSKNNS